MACRYTERFAVADENAPPASEMDWPKKGELRFPTGSPGLRLLKAFLTNMLRVRLYWRPVLPPNPKGLPPPPPLSPRPPRPPRGPRGPPPGPPPPLVSRPKPKDLENRKLTVAFAGPLQVFTGTCPNEVGVMLNDAGDVQFKAAFEVNQGRSL